MLQLIVVALHIEQLLNNPSCTFNVMTAFRTMRFAPTIK